MTGPNKYGDTIKMDHKEIRCSNVSCLHLTQERVQWKTFVNAVMNLNVKQKENKNSLAVEHLSPQERLHGAI